MSAFRDEPLLTADYELAAKLSNACRKNGIQGSHTDFLICAIAIRNESPIFTLDNDFVSFKDHIPIMLHAIHD